MIIPEYYNMFRERDPQDDFKEVVFEAMRYIYIQLQKAYAGEDTGPVDLSELPGQELGFEPVEIVSVSAPTVDNRRAAKKAGHYTASVTYKRMLARDDWTKTYPISALAAEEKDVFSGNAVPDIIKDTYNGIPDMGDAPYAIYRPDIVSNQMERLVPMLCNKTLGTIYYMKWKMYAHLIQSFSKRPKFSAAKLDGIASFNSTSPIVSINWITGDVGFIYDVQFDIFGEFLARFCPQYSCSWYLTDNQEMRARYSATAEEARIPVEELIEHEFGSKAKKTGVSFALCSNEKMEKHLADNYALLPCVETFTFIEDVYALPRNALQKTSLDQIERFYANYRREFNTIAFGLFITLSYTRNLFQCILQTWNLNNWLLPLILSSIRLGRPMKENYRSIPQWFNIPKPDYKALTSEPDEAKFVFYLCMNQFAPTSMKVFEKTYAKVLELSELCDENKKSTVYLSRGIPVDWNKKSVAIKSSRGRILLRTYSLPDTMSFYMGHNLQKHGLSINHYFKWLIDECYLAAHSDRPEIDRETHICGLVEHNTEDYNRMAKQISPKVPFTLPHNVCVAHDNMVTNYNKIMAERRSSTAEVDTDFAYKLAACYRGADADAVAPIADRWNPECDEKYIMIEPKKPADVYDEGIVLNHCVGSYCNDIIAARGSMRIYFMRPRRFPNHNLVTVQVNRLAATGEYYISEAAGKANRKITAEEDEYLQYWIKAYNMRIKFLAKEKAAIDKLCKEASPIAPMFSRDMKRWVHSVKGRFITGRSGLHPDNVKKELWACVHDSESIFAEGNYESAEERIRDIKTQCAYILGKDGQIGLAESSAVIAAVCA